MKCFRIISITAVWTQHTFQSVLWQRKSNLLFYDSKTVQLFIEYSEQSAINFYFYFYYLSSKCVSVSASVRVSALLDKNLLLK